MLPVVATLAGRHPERTVFTRFIPPERPDQMPGRGNAITHAGARAQLGFAGADAASGGLCPAGHRRTLSGREADALIISGSETDVCVLATVLSAVDLGYRVIVVRDAVCSSSDEGHDMLLRLYHTRFSEQIETADAATILSRWHNDHEPVR